MRAHDRIRSIVVALAILAVVGSLTSCKPIPVTPPDPTGTWKHGDARLVLGTDHTYIFTGAPVQVDGRQKWTPADTKTIDKSGTWDTDSEALFLNDDDGSYMVDVISLHGERALEFVLRTDEGDNCYDMVRETSEVKPSAPEDCVMWR